MSQGTTAAAPAAAVIDPDALLLFSVDLQGLTVTEGLAAYGAPDDPLIPIAELTRLLELDVDVHPRERRITGRIGGRGAPSWSTSAPISRGSARRK